MTLPEVLIGVVLLTTIMGAIAAALLVTIGPDDAAFDRLNVSNDSVLAALYVPDDVQSAASATPVDVDACGHGNGMDLAWTYRDGSNTEHSVAVSYRVVEEEGEIRLVRSSSTDGATSDRLIVGHRLDSPCAANFEESDRRVTVALTHTDGNSRTLEGLRRLPEPVCSIAALAPTTVQRDDDGHLTEDLAITLDPSPACDGNFSLVFSPSGSETFEPDFAGDPPSLTIPGQEYVWPFDSYDLQVMHDGDLVGTKELNVSDFVECSVVNVIPVPNPVDMVGGTLTEPVDVTVETAGACVELELAFRPDPDEAEVEPLDLGSSAPYAATIPADAYTNWVAGGRPLDVRVPGESTPLGSGLLTVNETDEPCSVLSVAAVPSSVARISCPGNNRTLSESVFITVSTEGACTDLSIQFQPTNPPSTQTQPLTESSPGSWTYTIPEDGQAGAASWSPGSKTLTVVGTAAGTITGSFTVT